MLTGWTEIEGGFEADYELEDDWRAQLDEAREYTDEADTSDRDVLGAFLAGADLERGRRDHRELLTGFRELQPLAAGRRVSSPVAQWNRAASPGRHVVVAGSEAWAVVYVSSHVAAGAPRRIVACDDCVAAYGPAPVWTGIPSARWVPVLVDPITGPSQRWADAAYLYGSGSDRADHPATAHEAGSAPGRRFVRPCDYCGGVSLLNPAPLQLDRFGGIDPDGSARAYALLDYCDQLANLDDDSAPTAYHVGRTLRESLADRPGVDADDAPIIHALFRQSEEIRRARTSWLGLAMFVDWNGTDGEGAAQRLAAHWMADADAWSVADTEILETCCGESVEWDCPTCPECGSPNPFREIGIL